MMPAVLVWLFLASDLVTRRSGAALDVALGLGLVLLVAVLGALVLRGRALGGLALGLRLVDARTGQPVRAGRLARRILGGSRPGLVWVITTGHVTDEVLAPQGSRRPRLPRPAGRWTARCRHRPR